jgi:multiple sugar transport system ATP-binding protein
MASISIRNLTKRYGNFTVIPDLNLEIADHEFVVFVGPSGCGKSTLLRIIAGLEPISGGDLYIGDKRVNGVQAAQRDIAMVFQDYALYPHMRVYDNMSFALELRGTPKAEIDARVKRAAALLHIEPYLDRKPKELPAASASASPWAAPSCAIPRRSCSTNRCPISMRSCAGRCAPRSRRCRRS